MRGGWGEGPGAARYLVMWPAWFAEGPHPNPLPPGEGTGMGLCTTLIWERGPEQGFTRRSPEAGLSSNDHAVDDECGQVFVGQTEALLEHFAGMLAEFGRIAAD